MKKLGYIAMLLIFLILSGCALPPREQAAQENKPPEPKRFVVIQEEGETKNLGGITVLKDTVTGKEYLVITGLNGAPTIINMQ